MTCQEPGKASLVARTVPRQRTGTGRDDYHDPTGGWGGAPPARSALTLRLALAIFGIVACAGAATAFVTAINLPAAAAVSAALGLLAVIDAVVIVRRMRGHEGG